MYKRIILCVLSSALLLLGGCNQKVEPGKADGDYATQNQTSAIEYSIYMNKQITVFANQILTRITMIRGSEEQTYENEESLARQSLETLQDTLEEVTITNPSTGKDDDRLSTIEVMQTAIDHLSAYCDALENEEDISGYVDIFQNDYNALTGLANLYNE